MRVLTLCLVTTLGVSSAACGGAAYEKAAPASPGSAHAGVAREMRAQTAGDRDADGIPDMKDEAPEPDKMAMLGNAAPPPAAPPPPPGQPGSGTGGGGATTPATAQPGQREGQYLIYTAVLTMAVYQVDGALTSVEQIGRDVGGYLAVRQDRSITIRVPRARFDEAVKKIEGTGDVVHRDIQAQDVTDEFLDTEVRLKNARAMRDRLQELLQRAPVKEALEIEKELGRITGEIEHMEGRLKLLKDKIAFSTITVNFDARAASLKTMPIRLPFGWLPQLGLPSLLRLNETK